MASYDFMSDLSSMLSVDGFMKYFMLFYGWDGETVYCRRTGKKLKGDD